VQVARVALDQTVLDGEIPTRAIRLVREWISIHQTELELCWNELSIMNLPVPLTRFTQRVTGLRKAPGRFRPAECCPDGPIGVRSLPIELARQARPGGVIVIDDAATQRDEPLLSGNPDRVVGRQTMDNRDAGLATARAVATPSGHGLGEYVPGRTYACLCPLCVSDEYTSTGVADPIEGTIEIPQQRGINPPK